MKVEKIKYRRTLLELKDQAHKYFDKLWKLGYISREELYIKLSEWLQVEEPKAHMSKMDSDQCKKVIVYSVMLLNDMRRLDLDFGDEPKHPYYEIIS